jgi:hypothetical protein
MALDAARAGAARRMAEQGRRYMPDPSSASARAPWSWTATARQSAPAAGGAGQLPFNADASA